MRAKKKKTTEPAFGERRRAVECEAAAFAPRDTGLSKPPMCDDISMVGALNDPIERELAICYRSRAPGSAIGIPYDLWARLALHRHAYDDRRQMVVLGGTPAKGSEVDIHKYPDAIAVNIGKWASCSTVNWGSWCVWFYPKL